MSSTVITCNVTNRDYCWVADTDEEILYNLKYRGELDELIITDVTGYTSSLEIRIKDTDVAPVLTIPAVIDIPEGKFLFEATDIQTLALLVNPRRSRYVYKILETDSIGKITLRMEGKLEVRL